MTQKKANDVKAVLVHQRDHILEKLSDNSCAEQWDQMERDLIKVKKRLQEIKIYL